MALIDLSGGRSALRPGSQPRIGHQPFGLLELIMGSPRDRASDSKHRSLAINGLGWILDLKRSSQASGANLSIYKREYMAKLASEPRVCWRSRWLGGWSATRIYESRTRNADLWRPPASEFRSLDVPLHQTYRTPYYYQGFTTIPPKQTTTVPSGYAAGTTDGSGAKAARNQRSTTGLLSGRGVDLLVNSCLRFLDHKTIFHT
jgi:hypothetical protein